MCPSFWQNNLRLWIYWRDTSPCLIHDSKIFLPQRLGWLSCAIAAGTVLRIGFEHKQSAEAKEIYQLSNKASNRVHILFKANTFCLHRHTQAVWHLLLPARMGTSQNKHSWNNMWHPSYLDIWLSQVPKASCLPLSSNRPQVICALLAAHCASQLPLDIDLRDGQIHAQAARRRSACLPGLHTCSGKWLRWKMQSRGCDLAFVQIL